MEVRALTAGDLDWVVGLAARRGAERESFAPRFWRRAPDARRTHARFLGSLIADPAVPTLRTDHAFVFGERRADVLLVDDAAVESVEQWATEGAALLRHLAGEGRVRFDCRVRFVCPVPEPERAALAVRLGLTCRETWWHRDLPIVTRPTASEPVRLVQAPPVYAPGGPVLLVTDFRDGRALAEVEQRAAHQGAVVSVVSVAPGDRVREEVLSSVGYRRTCDFYEGSP